MSALILYAGGMRHKAIAFLIETRAIRPRWNRLTLGPSQGLRARHFGWIQPTAALNPASDNAVNSALLATIISLARPLKNASLLSTELFRMADSIPEHSRAALGVATPGTLLSAVVEGG